MMMLLAAHQPDLLPWSGFFWKMDSCIDWDAYARNLQNDYTFCRVGGTVYVISSH